MEEQLEDEDDEDVYTLSKVGDVVHAMFATYKEHFLPIFERLLPRFTKLLVRFLHPGNNIIAERD